MRVLTIKQKNLLRKWFKEREPNERDKLIFNKTNDLRAVEDLTDEQYEKLQEINDTEVLYQNVNGFIWDLKNEQ